jgi:hypothetical protein
MRPLFTALGVDYDQWRALTLVALKLDWRTTSLGRSNVNQQVRSAASLLIMQLVFYTMFGLGMAAMVWYSKDLFLSGTLLTAYLLFIVGGAVLLDHNSAMTSPADFPILGFRPVSSRTYFAVRLTNVLVYTTAITTVAAYLPIGALFLWHGGRVGIAGLLACYGWSVVIALFILLSYAWMLRLVGPEAIKRALSYVQLVMSFAVYGGYILIPRIFTRALISGVAIRKTLWILLFPGTWFASYLDLASGKTGPMEVAPALLSILALAGLAAGASGRLSLAYSERLGAITTEARRVTRTKASTARGVLFREGEARAVALLIRSQFRNDQKFRLGVLGILPLTLLYVYLGVHDGGMSDPFVRPAGGGGYSLVTMAVMMFPSMLYTSFTRSESYRASWVFFVTPASRVRVIRSSKNVLTVQFLIPYLLLITALYLYFVGHVSHVLVHITLLGLLSHLILQVQVLLSPELPFSKPPQKSGRASMLMGFMMLTIVIAIAFQILAPSLYSSVVATAIAFGVVVGASVVVDRLMGVRVEAQARSLELEG